MARGRAIFLAKLLVSASLLAFLFWRVDRAAFLRTLAALPPLVFLACFALYLLGYLLSTVRWHRLLAAEAIQIPFWRLTLVYFEGAFFNLFLPTLIGGDIVRGVAIYRITGGHPASLASILLDRLSGFAALLCIALAALLLAADRIASPEISALVVAVAAAFAGLLTVLLHGRLTDRAVGLLRVVGLARFEAKLQGLVDAIRRYRGHRRALGTAFLLSGLLQAMIILTYYIVGEALGVGIPVGYYFLAVPLITVISMLPVSVAGLGVREGSVVYFFSRVGVDAATALSMSLIWFSLTILVSSLGGLAFLANAHAAKRAESSS